GRAPRACGGPPPYRVQLHARGSGVSGGARVLLERVGAPSRAFDLERSRAVRSGDRGAVPRGPERFPMTPPPDLSPPPAESGDGRVGKKPFRSFSSDEALPRSMRCRADEQS